MHDGSLLEEMSHFTLSFGHSVYGLLVLLLIIVTLAFLFRNKD